MEAMDILAAVRDKMGVKTIVGEPISNNGVTVVPVVRVSGGGGGGAGTDQNADDKQSSGQGLGFGLRSAPVGVFVINGDKVTWQPAIDLTRVILGGQLVAIVTLLTIRTIVKARARRHR